MNIIQKLSDKNQWEAFLAYKIEQGSSSKQELADLQLFVQQEEYTSVVQSIKNGEPMPPPQKLLISKSGSTKKRTVYSFERSENYVLKLITFFHVNVSKKKV